MFKKWFLSMFVPLFVFVAAFGAPPGPGNLRGRVVDTSGSPVLDLTIVLINTSTRSETTAKTDRNGEFVLAGLEAGKYSIQIPNGQNAPRDATVDSNSTTSVMLERTGAVTLELKAETVAPDMSTAPIQTIYNSTQVELLPHPNALNRNGQYFGPYNLSLLSEGMTHGNALQDGVGPSVAGRPITSNNYHAGNGQQQSGRTWSFRFGNDACLGLPALAERAGCFKQSTKRSARTTRRLM